VKGTFIIVKKIDFSFFCLLIISTAFIALLSTGCFNLSALSNTGTENIKIGATASNAADSLETSTAETAQESTNSPAIDSETSVDGSENTAEAPPVNKDDAALKYSVVTKEVYELESGGKREIIAKYPFFEHQDNSEVFYTANNTIKNEYIDFWINDFRDITDEAFEYMEEDMPGPLGLEINYSMEYMDNRCISVLLYNFSYTGGAHPYAFASAYNYDIEKRKDILLDSLFAEGYDYLGFLSAYCYEDIKNNYIEIDVDPADVEDWIIEGTDPSEPGNFRDFNLTEDSLMITFDPYEVGPYAMGAFTVYIPYAEFNGNILYP